MKKTLLTTLFLLCTLVPLWSYAANGEENKKDTDSISAKALPASVEALSPDFPELNKLVLGNASNAQPMANTQ